MRANPIHVIILDFLFMVQVLAPALKAPPASHTARFIKFQFPYVVLFVIVTVLPCFVQLSILWYDYASFSVGADLAAIFVTSIIEYIVTALVLITAVACAFAQYKLYNQFSKLTNEAQFHQQNGGET